MIQPRCPRALHVIYICIVRQSRNAAPAHLGPHAPNRRRRPAVRLAVRRQPLDQGYVNDTGNTRQARAPVHPTAETHKTGRPIQTRAGQSASAHASSAFRSRLSTPDFEQSTRRASRQGAHSQMGTRPRGNRRQTHLTSRAFRLTEQATGPHKRRATHTCRARQSQRTDLPAGPGTAYAT